MIRLALILLSLAFLGLPAAATAQKPSTEQAVAAPISADQARVALDVLSDPAKRAAFAATLNAIIKAQPAAAASAGTAPAQSGKPPPNETTVEGVTIPLAPDSLGAQVLLSASGFVNHAGNQAMAALDTVQSLPLLYGWVVMVVTNPLAHDILVDVSWRAVLVLAVAGAIEFGLRRAMQRPIRSLESLAPPIRLAESDPLASQGGPDDDTVVPADADAIARAEAGDIEAPAPRRPRPSAWTLLKRVPLVVSWCPSAAS
jgi:hypothetical protein